MMPKASSIKNFLHPIIAWVKTWIVTLAVWGWLPYKLAEWIKRQGGHHED